MPQITGPAIPIFPNSIDRGVPENSAAANQGAHERLLYYTRSVGFPCGRTSGDGERRTHCEQARREFPMAAAGAAPIDRNSVACLYFRGFRVQFGLQTLANERGWRARHGAA